MLFLAYAPYPKLFRELLGRRSYSRVVGLSLLDLSNLIATTHDYCSFQLQFSLDFIYSLVIVTLSMDLLHESVLSDVLQRLDTRTRCALLGSCKDLCAVSSRSDYWYSLEFVSAKDQGLEPLDLLRCLQRSNGNVRVLKFARTEEARCAQSERRFNNGYKCTEQSPYTQGLRSLAFAALLPNLQQLSLDERTSCIGGMTDDFARGIAWHCACLQVLEVFFDPYSLPSELFTDDGMILVTESCRSLRSVTLHNCTALTDRSLYALAANCKGLEELDIAGYYERISDYGLTILFDSCKDLRLVRLSSKMLRVSDVSAKALAASCSNLRIVKLPRTIGDEGITALLKACTGLEELDLSSCETISDGLHKLLTSPQYSSIMCRLPNAAYHAVQAEVVT